VTLTWTAANGAPDTYIVEAGSFVGSANLLVRETGTLATSLTAPVSPGTSYVRLRAKNTCGTGAASADAVSAITDSSQGAVPGTPVLTLEANLNARLR